MAAFARFWVVWDENSATIERKHKTKASAEIEALRLADKHPKCQFIVLVAILKTPPGNPPFLVAEDDDGSF